MPAQDNNWSDWEPQKSIGKFSKYENRIAVPIARTSSEKGVKGRLYLTTAVMKYLGNPKYIKIKTRGQNIAITASNTSDGSYTVANKASIKNATPFISCGSFVEKYRHENFVISQGVYDAHVDAGMVIFDIAQTPARF